MNNYRKSAHATYRCEYHFVWTPKYRYKVLIENVKPRLQQILYNLCEWLDIDMIEGAIMSDHIHMYLSVPPKYSPSEVMKILKGKSAELLIREYPKLLRKKYGSRHLWSRGYFVTTVGMNSEVIRKYVQNQVEEEERERQLRLWRDV